jgi:hypothetical protein
MGESGRGSVGVRPRTKSTSASVAKRMTATATSNAGPRRHCEPPNALRKASTSSAGSAIAGKWPPIEYSCHPVTRK